MSHWRKNFEATDKAIGAHSLEKDGKYEPTVVTIERFYNDKITGSMGTENKRFVKLKEFRLPMVINVTNYKRLEKFFGSFDESDYIGKQITLGVEDVKVAGETMKALRFSTRPIVAKKQLATIKDEDFPAVIEKIQKGELTIEKLKTIRELSVEQLEKLNGIKS